MSIVSSFNCPSDTSPARDTTNADEIWNDIAGGTSYVGNVGDNCLGCNPAAGTSAFCANSGFVCRGPQLADLGGSGIFWRFGSNVGLRDVTDGTSNTFLAGEQIMKYDPLECLGPRQPIRRDDRVASELQVEARDRRELDPPIYFPQQTPGRGELRHVRRLGEVHQEHD